MRLEKQHVFSSVLSVVPVINKRLLNSTHALKKEKQPTFCEANGAFALPRSAGQKFFIRFDPVLSSAAGG